MSNSEVLEIGAEELFGPFNEHEKKYPLGTLFIRGDRSLVATGPRVSIVGSRKASLEGQKRARKLARLLVENEVVIVSGLAEGIDTAAHRGAIENGGKTVAVIGTPIDQYYPKSNKELQETIANEHLLISQFPIGSKLHPSNFVQRNRTMAMLAHTTVIIEAANKSGSHHQGWEAIRLNRNLYIAESLVKDPSLTWTEKMLDHGAQVLCDETFQVLLDELPPVRSWKPDEDVEIASYF